MDARAVFNGADAALWIVIGISVWWHNRQSSILRGWGRASAVWFVLFGISDILEIFTGAWWRPLALLMFKAACLTGLVTCAIAFYRLRRSRDRWK